MSKSEIKEDKHYRKARFEDLHSIQIGNYFLYENDLQTYFGDDEESIILLKRIFQTQYKITRTSSGLPRVPSRTEDKQRIIQLLQSYFNRLRSKILEKRLKSGDSVSLRENIDGIQQIKLLIDHFEESTETFPYHMFKDYLDNKEYIKSTGDINKQMREFQFNKSQNERIRNLLRQFSLLYLKDKKQEQFDVRDPGVFSGRFKEFMKDRDLSKLPPILVDLLKLLDGKYSVIAQEDEKIRDELYNPEKVYTELDRLLSDIDKQVEIQKGGAKPVIDKIRGTKGLDEQMTSVVDYVLQKYKELHQAHKYVILNKDSEYDMLDHESTKKILELQEKLDKAESDLSLENLENARLNEQIAKLNKDISDKNDEIENKNKSINTLTLQLKGANDNLSRSLKNKDYSESEVSRLQQMLDTQVKTLTEQLRETQQQVANLDEEKSGLEEERNSLNTELLAKTAKVAELEAEVLRLNGLLSQQKIDLSGNEEILDDYKRDITKLKLDLSGARTRIGEDAEYMKQYETIISKKDAMILDLSSNLTRTKKQLDDANKEADKLMQSSIKDIKRLKDEIDRITRDKKRLEDQLKECRENLAKRLSEQKSKFDSEIDKLSSSTSAEIQRLRNELAGVEQRIQDMDDIMNELKEIIDANESGSIQLKANLARITTERDSLKTENARLNNEINALRGSVASSTLQTQLDAAIRDKKTAEDKLRMKEAELAAVKAELASKDEEIVRIKAEYTRNLDLLKQENASLKSEVDRLKTQGSINTATALTLQNYLRQIEKLGEEKAENLRRIGELERSLDEKLGIISQLQTDKGILDARILELQSINRELNERTASMNEQLREFENNKTKLRESETQIRELIEKIDELNKKFDGEKQKIIDTMTQQMKSFEQSTIREKTDLLKRISELETELAATEANRRTYLEANESITATNEQLKSEINRIKSQLNACLDKDKLKRDRPVEPTQVDEQTPTIDKNRWLIEIKNLFKKTFSYGVKNNYDFLRTVQSYIADINDLQYQDLAMMLNYIIKTLGSIPDTSIIFENGVMQDLELKPNVKITLLNLVNDIKKTAKDYKLLDSSNTVLNSTEFRRVLDSQATKKFEIIQTLKDKIDYILDKIFQYVADPQYIQTRSLFERYQNNRSRKRTLQRGGSDLLFDYCSKIANNSLKEFLLETPLPFFSLIKEFEKDSNLDVIQSINEEHILKLFITQHLKTYFESKEMKQFYFHAKELFGKDKESIYNNAKMFFVLQEIINTIRSDERKIDVLRIKSKEYNSSFDYLNFILESHEYDFYNVAKKELLNTKAMNMTFKDNFIYIALTDKDDHLYDFNKNLTTTVSNYKYKNDIYYINDSMIYLFFILSTHFYLQSENLIDLDDYEEITNNLESTVRKLKRLKSKDQRSIETLMKERKDFKEIK